MAMFSLDLGVEEVLHGLTEARVHFDIATIVVLLLCLKTSESYPSPDAEV